MAVPTPMDPRRLYREIVEIEKQLRELLRSNPLNAQDANVLRARLMEKARLLAQASATFAAQREIEQVLWKPCFYKRIEDFRRRIRKYAAAPSNDSSVRQHFARVSLEFQEFLNDASAFYESLRGSFTKWLLQNRVSRIASAGNVVATPSEAAANTDKCRTSLHRCLVFLGDLARYRELHSQKAKKNFAAAESFYHKALSVIPENGNPHNQLAVLATYVESETVAVYRYCRSLLIAQPFATAEENLALLFERSRQRPLAPPTTAIITAASTSKDKSAYLKSFLHRLTRMHGIIFSIATRQAPPGSNSSSAPAPVYSKEMESLLMKDLMALLTAGIVGDALLLKLVVTNVFCVVRSAGSKAADDALRLAVRMVAVAMDFLVVELSKMEAKKAENSNGFANSPAPQQLPNSLRLLCAVSAFFDFLRLNSTVLDELDTMLSRQNDADLCKKFVAEFFEQLVNLLNHSKVQAEVHAAGAENDRSFQELKLQLKENIELRGFKPLSTQVDIGAGNRWREELAAQAANAGRSPSPPVTPVLSDQESWKVRARNVHSFGKFLCEDYEGNPLLYQYKGQFSTSPSVISSISNNFSTTKLGVSSVNGDATPAFSAVGLFGAPTPPPAPTVNGSTNSSADDFDDEIIVYQPSPSLAPAQPRNEVSATLGSSLLGGSPTPFGADPFSLGSTVFGSATPQQRESPQAHGLSSSSSSPSASGSLFGSLGSPLGTNSDSGSVGPSLGFQPFNSFGNLGSFSGQGFLSGGWGGVAATQPVSSPVTSLSGTFLTSHDASKGQRSTLFGDMDDLAAVEHESSLYQQKESTLSAFLGPSPLSAASSGRSSSIGTSKPAPPPGFMGSASSSPSPASPPGFGLPPSGLWQQTTSGSRQPPQTFFTRNPFVNP